MARVTDAEVKGILDTDLDTTPFIATATLLVNRHGTGTTEELKELERWLTAWLVCTREPQHTQWSTDGQSATLATQSYWETIRLLDTSGRLALALTSKPAYVTID